ASGRSRAPPPSHVDAGSCAISRTSSTLASSEQPSTTLDTAVPPAPPQEASVSRRGKCLSRELPGLFVQIELRAAGRDFARLSPRRRGTASGTNRGLAVDQR